MKQNTNNSKKKDIAIDKEDTSFMRVDHQGNFFTNFINNLKRQFKKTEGLGLSGLFRAKPAGQKQATNLAQSIIGPSKTDIGSVSLNPTHTQTVKAVKRSAIQSNQKLSPKSKLKI